MAITKAKKYKTKALDTTLRTQAQIT